MMSFVFCNRVRARVFAAVVVVLLLAVLAYPRVRPVESFYLKGVKSVTFDSDLSKAFYLSNTFGLRNLDLIFRGQDLKTQNLMVSELREEGEASYHVDYQYSEKAVFLSETLLATSLRDGGFLKHANNNEYHLIRTDRVPLQEHVFEHEAVYEGGDGLHQVYSRFSPVSITNDKVRNIEYVAFLTEDYSSNHSVDTLIKEVLSTTLQANQFLRPAGFNLVLKGVRIYRNTSPFAAATRNRDPHSMLNTIVDEHHRLKAPERNLSIVFSDTYFPTASGLSYVGTSCVNYRYSGIFVTRGGSMLTRQVAFPSTLAHEVGHYLGMTHDTNQYPYGSSLMSPSTVMVPFGFSEHSLLQQRSHSGIGMSGGSCFAFEKDHEDTDGDGVSDTVEKEYGSNYLDPASAPVLSANTMYGSWNGFKNQVAIGEAVTTSSLYTGVNMEMFDLNGTSLLSRNFMGRGHGQSDIIFNEHLPQFTDSYGIVKVSSSAPVTGRSNIYAHTGVFNAFDFISTHPLFLPVRSNFPVVVPYNFYVPNGFPQGSQIFNWLTVINLTHQNEKFIIHEGGLESGSSKVIEVPAMGRRDILPGDGGSGFVIVKPESKKHEVLYHAFISRYYQRPDGALSGSVHVDGRVPGGEKKFVFYDSDIAVRTGLSSSQIWAEISNVSPVPVSATVEVFSSISRVSRTEVAVPAGGSVHVPLPDNAAHLVSISSASAGSLGVSAFRYNGGSLYSSVEQLPVTEALMGEFSGSWNTFLNTGSKLVLGNPSGEGAVLSCLLSHNSNEIHASKEVGKAYIQGISMKELFPAFPVDAYAPVRCTLTSNDGKYLRSLMKMTRLVDGKHVNNHLFR